MNILTKVILLILTAVVLIGIIYSVTAIPDSDNDVLTCFVAAVLTVIGTVSFACVAMFRNCLDAPLTNWVMPFSAIAGVGGIFAMCIHFKTTIIACVATWIICIAIYIKRKQ